jgi:hypothetical protein
LKKASSGENTALLSILFTHCSLVIEVYQSVATDHQNRMIATNAMSSSKSMENSKWVMFYGPDGGEKANSPKKTG